ncbi:NAD(P)-binding protein [Abortiporus biennis]|nr:NAD(P)-binding protein [Abortiporus biennis]
MSSTKTSVFITGATGYIGGSILARLLAPQYKQDLDISALLRSNNKAGIFQSKFGVHPVIGSLDDEEILAQAASQAHIVINTANCDDLKAAKAILRGLKKRHETNGDIPLLIHTSGTGTLTANDKGLTMTPQIYDDLNPDQIETLPPTAQHRNVDLEIVAADKEGYVKSYIVLPSSIYGIAHNILVDDGLAKKASFAMLPLIQIAAVRGEVGVVGKGLNVWGAVHIDEVADAYMLIFDAIRSNPDAVGHGRNGYYFLENGEYSAHDLTKAIAKTLYEIGKVKSSEPTAFTPEELVNYFGSQEVGYMFGTTSRAVSNRIRALGWKPQKTVQDLFASIKEEIAGIL